MILLVIDFFMLMVGIYGVAMGVEFAHTIAMAWVVSITIVLLFISVLMSLYRETRKNFFANKKSNFAVVALRRVSLIAWVAILGLGGSVAGIVLLLVTAIFVMVMKDFTKKELLKND